jgi:hypothetical protein
VPCQILLTDPPEFDILLCGHGSLGRMPFDQLHRREFITLLGGAAAWPVAIEIRHIVYTRTQKHVETVERTQPEAADRK